jgi:cell division septal protein FtsQ
MLGAWHYIAIALPVILLAIEWRRARALMVIILFTGIVLGATQIAIDLRIRAIRELSITPISSLPHNDPIRRRFGVLHGISSILLLAQVIVAAGAVAADTES